MKYTRFIPVISLLFFVLSILSVAVFALGEPPSPPPPQWVPLLGRYEENHSTHFILREEGGILEILLSPPGEKPPATLNFRNTTYGVYPLSKTGTDTFTLHSVNGFQNDTLSFQRDPQEYGYKALWGPRVFERVFYGPDRGDTFRITPVRPIDEIREEAFRSTPPSEEGNFLEAELVDLSTLEPKLILDLKYATEDNFMGVPLYATSRAFLQQPAAEALSRAHRVFRSLGYGMVVFDAYRPWFVTKMFWEATPDEQKNFVGNPRYGSRHNRGCAVDIALIELDSGELVDFGGGFDEFTDRSFTDYPGGSARSRWYRAFLEQIMAENGFIVYADEWWHFDFHTWFRYPIMNTGFEDL